METKKNYTKPRSKVISITTTHMLADSPPAWGGEGGARQLDFDEGEW